MIKLLTVLSFSLLSTSALVAPAMAQTAVEATVQQEIRIEQADVARETQSVTGDLQSAASAPGIDVVADVGDDSVALVISRSWDDNYGDLGFNSFRMKLSGKADKGQGSFLTDEGFPSGVAAEVGFTRVWSRDAPRAISLSRAKELTTAARAVCVGPIPTDEKKKVCAAKSASELAEYLPADEAKEIQTDEWLRTPLWFTGFSGGVGYQEFEFRNPLNLAELQEERVPFSAAVYVGVAPAGRPLYLGSGFEFKEAYEEASKQTLCGPPPATGLQECFTAPFAEPTKRSTASLFGILRAQGRVLNWPVGVEIKPAYDFKSEVGGVSARFFAFADKDKHLRGGVKLDWQSDDNNPLTEDDNFKASIFFGTAFGLYPSK